MHSGAYIYLTTEIFGSVSFRLMRGCGLADASGKCSYLCCSCSACCHEETGRWTESTPLNSRHGCQPHACMHACMHAPPAFKAIQPCQCFYPLCKWRAPDPNKVNTCTDPEAAAASTMGLLWWPQPPRSLRFFCYRGRR